MSSENVLVKCLWKIVLENVLQKCPLRNILGKNPWEMLFENFLGKMPLHGKYPWKKLLVHALVKCHWEMSLGKYP